ncbi:MAG TPA: alanine--tRNA ligase [Candidatus Polarisedimenticolia bacterium]|nr:alanine--tRNA ligase [Candidatus Polarisedimenticolia bacterium]
MTGTGTREKSWSGNEIREAFLRFFESKGHRRVRSSSLVPHGDPTLLFTNAGMNQFKDVFLGLEKRDYNKATSAQKCVRAGGKHNDLENVGFTKRHHTFFEMLGNFSFGDYFKKDAIAYAWELVTSPEWFGIAKDKLYVTVFGGAELSGHQLGVDEEAKGFWLEQRVPEDRIFGIPGLKENFWAMGDTGPCGPCSEIHYDMSPAASEQGHTDCKFPCDCGRYVEIWNLVFMQFNRFWACERPVASHDEGTFDARIQEGVAALTAKHEHSPKCLGIEPLPKPCVDTGMGLERVAAVLQGVISNYDTDLFVPLLEEAQGLLVLRNPKGAVFSIEPSNVAASLNVIADHSRAFTFLISDGVIPSNDGRGYVLRKIIRRAIRHARFLGSKNIFLYEMVSAVAREMQHAYPELIENEQRISKIVKQEETQFEKTIAVGLSRFDEDVKELIRGGAKTHDLKMCNDPAVAEKGTERALYQFLLRRGVTLTYPGDKAFKLYDTFGVPLDFIIDACRDEGIEFDLNGFDKAMNEQKKRARASWKGGAKEAANPAYAKIADRFKTGPDFYFGTTAKDSRIEAIITKNGPVNELKAGESGEVVLTRTAIYAESGGQVADTGAFYDNSESQLLAEVKGAFYPVAGLVAHKIVAKDTLRVGDRVAVVADAERRARIIRNHTGTHLVNAALRNILGTHVKQSGSLNAPDRLRFDFSHFAHVDAEELRDIEQQVNDEIRLNTEVETNVTSLEEALASGALAFFGDKYPEHNVRVVTIPDPRATRGFYSKELCGGTHVQRVGDIGVLKIVGEESVAAGVRRVEAVTGIGALEHFQKQADILRQLASQLNVGEDGILAQVEKLSQTAKQLEKELEAQKRKGALSQIDELAGRVQVVKGIKLIAAEVQNVDREGLRQLVDSLRQKLGSGVVALGMPENGKVALIAGVTKDLTAKVHAGKLIQVLAKQLGGSGGGRPDLAEAGAKDTAGLKSALLSIPSLLEPLL